MFIILSRDGAEAFNAETGFSGLKSADLYDTEIQARMVAQEIGVHVNNVFPACYAGHQCNCPDWKHPEGL